jgi:DNA-binding NarL/FixJ family response regulator
VLKSAGSGSETAWRDALSPREGEVVALVAAGASNRTIGFILAISDKAVEKHLSSAFAKLGASSRTQIAARVIAEGAGRRRRGVLPAAYE